MPGSRILLAAVVALVAGWASPAGAVVADNPIGCRATAAVEGTAGKGTFVDARDVEARLPRRGTVDWTAAVAAPAHQASGNLRARIGLWDVVVASWGPTPNGSDLVAQQDATPLPELLRYLPPGRYRVRGAHRSAEGRCTGALTVVVSGSTLTTRLTVGAALAAAAFALATLRCGRRRPGRARGRPVLGAVAGLCFGATSAVVLLSTYLVASDSRLLWAVPVLGVVAGLALGVTAPFAGRVEAEPGLA